MTQQQIQCPICDTDSATLFFDERYGGFRGTCMLCGGNFPES